MKKLREFWQQPGREDAEQPLRTWYKAVEQANWSTSADVRSLSRSADFVGDRVVFNIRGNNYRLVVLVHYERKIVYVRWIGTHDEYDHIDVTEV